MKKKSKDTKEKDKEPKDKRPTSLALPNAATAPKAVGVNGLMHGYLVNNSEHSDFTIVVAGTKKESIAAHEVFLSFRGVQGLLSTPSLLCSSITKKGGHTTATISESALVFCNSAILITMLKYVYVSDVSAIEASDDLPFLVNLLATLTAAGLGDKYIARVVEEKVMSLTTLSTVHMLIARTFEYKLDRLHFQIRAFAFSNWSAFISDKDGCRRLGVELLSKLSAANAKPDAPPTFPPPAAADQLLVDFNSMLSSASASGDLVLECAKEGQVGAHRCVLAVFCEGFRSEIIQGLVASPSSKKKSTGPSKTEIKLHSQNHLLTVAAANALLHFIYCGNANFSQEIAVNLILALCEYRIASLESACESAIQKPCDLSTAFPILGITFHPLWVARPSMGPLRKSVTDFIVQNFKDLDLNMWSDLPPVLFHALQALQRAQSRSDSGSTAVAASSNAAASPAAASAASVSSPSVPIAVSSARISSPMVASSVAASPPRTSEAAPALPAKPAVFVPDDEEVASGVSDSEEGRD